MHEPISFTYYAKYGKRYYKKPVTYIGKDAAKVFVPVSYTHLDVYKRQVWCVTPQELTVKKSFLFISLYGTTLENVIKISSCLDN